MGVSTPVTQPLPPGAEVEIPCGTRVEVRTDLKAKIGGLRVRGELAFLDGADVELDAVLRTGAVNRPICFKENLNGS